MVELARLRKGNISIQMYENGIRRRIFTRSQQATGFRSTSGTFNDQPETRCRIWVDTEMYAVHCDRPPIILDRSQQQRTMISKPGILAPCRRDINLGDSPVSTGGGELTEIVAATRRRHGGCHPPQAISVTGIHGPARRGEQHSPDDLAVVPDLPAHV